MQRAYVKHEPKIEKPYLSVLVAECRQILANVRKLIESIAVKVDTDSSSRVLVEPKIVEEPESKFVEDTEPEPEMEEPESEMKELGPKVDKSEVEVSLIETSVDLPAEAIMKLVPSLMAISFEIDRRLRPIAGLFTGEKITGD